jgi:hypothetical protein
VNIIVMLNGADVTNVCRLSETRISFDSTRRITTANLTIMGDAISREARYDYAHYGQSVYALDLRELYEVTILDGRDGVTKLFDGQIYVLEMEQSDGPTFDLFYKCELNDWAAWLDRSVCWDMSFALTLPASDQAILTALLTEFCPKITLASIANIVPAIQAFDWKTKTCRQVLDDLCALSMGEWRVDFDGKLYYALPSAAPAAPFDLSTTPDYVSSFPVRVSGYRHDFSNPINRAYVRGAIDAASGAAIEASYSDPVSISQYGEYQSAVVDEQITTAADASLRAKSTVLKYSAPIEQGNFTIWKDGLALGMQVSIHDDWLGLDGQYIIRALTMAWEDQYTVRYEAQFGAAQPDLETILRLIEQRSSWKTANPQVGTPAPGSVTDASIAAGGLHATSIGSVNANTILGQLTATQIGSVNAGAIVGAVTASQISTVNATSIQGAVVASQIGSVNATTIQGVVVSSQLADQIINNLAKYVDALRPVPMVQTSAGLPTLPDKNYPPNSFFYYVPDGHFYQINAAGTAWALNDNPQSVSMSFYHIGAISASSIVGLIVAAQIQTITAGQITGQISAGQINSVNASSISGQVTAAQIATVNASSIQGSLSAGQIGSVNASSITGTLASTQIGSVNAATITIGLVQSTQIGSVNGGTITAGTVSSAQLNSTQIDVGGGGSKPGKLNVWDGSSNIIAQLGLLSTGNYGGWFKVFGAGGSDYNSAAVKTDTGGNLSVTNATFTVNAGGAVISISPTTVDPTYSSGAVQVTAGSDKTVHISRGIILYSGSSVIGSLDRASGGSWAELVVGSIFLNSGGTNLCRADGGFGVAGNAGVTETFSISGTQLRFMGGIYIGH